MTAFGLLFSPLTPDKGRKQEEYFMNREGRPRTFLYPVILLRGGSHGSEQLWARAQVTLLQNVWHTLQCSKTGKPQKGKQYAALPQRSYQLIQRDFKYLWEFLLVLQLAILFTYPFSLQIAS